MFSWLKRGDKSKDTLKDRLKLVLTYDRARLSPGQMDELKHELLTIVSKYFAADDHNIDVQIEHEEDRMRVVANVPRQG